MSDPAESVHGGDRLLAAIATPFFGILGCLWGLAGLYGLFGKCANYEGSDPCDSGPLLWRFQIFIASIVGGLALVSLAFRAVFIAAGWDNRLEITRTREAIVAIVCLALFAIGTLALRAA